MHAHAHGEKEGGKAKKSKRLEKITEEQEGRMGDHRGVSHDGPMHIHACMQTCTHT